MKRLLMMLMTICSMLYAADVTESVVLSGTVKDTAGKSLEGVTVALAKIKDLSTKTNVAGAFTLKNVTGVLLEGNHRASFGLTLRNNAIVFTTGTERTAGTISLFSGDGRLIGSTNLDNLHTRQQIIKLPELSSGLYLLSGTVNDESFTRSLFCMGNTIYLPNETIKSNGNRSFRLGKSAATTVNDTLIASKEGYDTTRYTLTSYAKDGIEITMNKAGSGKFTITSPKFVDGDSMPDQYTCEGKTMGSEIAPPLEWVNPPVGTKSYALFFKDLTLADKGSPLGFHWGMWNIPVTITKMPEGLGSAASPPEMGGATQKGALGNKFFGPCPSSGSTRTKDTYAFILYAFDKEKITPPTNLQQMDKYFDDNDIGKTSISVWSRAKAK